MSASPSPTLNHLTLSLELIRCPINISLSSFASYSPTLSIQPADTTFSATCIMANNDKDT